MQLLIKEYKLMTGYEKINLFKMIYNRLFNEQFQARVYIQKMQRTRWKLKKFYLRRKLLKKFRICIGMDTVIGEKLSLQHVEVGGDILTGEIGDNCVIYHQVTIGNKAGKYPIIGNNVTIYSGARVFGNIHVGNNVVIGTNAVVIHDVPDNSVVAGVPARIIK